jgi:colanic acid biosynthesis glycosyl transferase WcaI
MGSRILLIGYNFTPEPTGIGKYSGEMIHWLAKRGYDCSVITTYPYYPYWRVQEPYRRYRFWFKNEKIEYNSGGRISIHRCPIYVPEKPSGIKRILLDLSFFISAFLCLLTLVFSKRFDVVLTVAPSFQIGLLGVFYKICRKARFIHHMQDLQIEAARELNILKSNMLINILFRIEKYILNQADVLSSISEGMVEKIKKKTGKEVFLLPNWTDSKLIYPLNNQKQLKIEFGFKPSDKIILYSGAIGEKQGLESILYAAREFIHDENVKFIICGSGPYKSKLICLTKEYNLPNVFFLPLQPVEDFNRFLNIGDVHLVIQKANASDLVMPSKLTNILAVGSVPIVTANKGSSLYTLIHKYKMGYVVNADDQQSLNRGIQDSIHNGNEYIKRNARKYAENYLSIDKILGKLDSLLSQINNSTSISDINKAN